MPFKPTLAATLILAAALVLIAITAARSQDRPVPPWMQPAGATTPKSTLEAIFQFGVGTGQTIAELESRLKWVLDNWVPGAEGTPSSTPPHIPFVTAPSPELKP